jgi:HK97 family phage prohead protease
MKHVRFIPNDICGLHLREPQEGQEESRVVDGEPIIFGVRSVNLTPWSSTRKVYEVLEPGCITKELLQRSDVVFNINHSNMVTDVLGRYRNTAKDTLKLELTQRNVKSSCDLPKTNAANDTLELIKRGDISGMSFAFIDDWEDTENGVSYERTNEVEDGKEVWIRHVKRIVELFDVSIVTHPAYEQTSVGTREASDDIEKAIDAQIKGAGQQRDNNPDEEQQKREAEEKAMQEAALRRRELLNMESEF